MNIKMCSRCGEPKDASAFYKDARNKDGLTSHCKICHKKCTAQYKQDHRAEMLQCAAQYRQGHRDEIAQRSAQWRKANPDKVRAQNHRRRARQLGNGGTYTAQDVQRQGDSQNWLCWWRGPNCLVDCRETYHVDHLIPLARGGHNNPSNIVITCPFCNQSKKDKTPYEWIGRLL